MGWKSLLKTLNFHSVRRTLLLHECSFDENSRATGSGGSGSGTGSEVGGVQNNFNLMYPTGKYK